MTLSAIILWAYYPCCSAKYRELGVYLQEGKLLPHKVVAEELVQALVVRLVPRTK